MRELVISEMSIVSGGAYENCVAAATAMGAAAGFLLGRSQVAIQTGAIIGGAIGGMVCTKDESEDGDEE